jgi:HEPN domain-containing protein
MNMEKQVNYWQVGAAEEAKVAEELIHQGHIRQGLFFAHLALEKILKAHVVKKTGDISPRLHNLSRLQEIAGIKLSAAHEEFLKIMNTYNQIGRYPEELEKLPAQETADRYIQMADEVLACLQKMLLTA